MKRIILLTAFFIAVLNTNGQQYLNGYLETAARNNPGIKASFAKYMASLQRIDKTGNLPDPQIVFGYFIMPVETRNGPQIFKISATQMFPWFGLNNSKKDVATQTAMATYQEFEELKAKLFFDVRSTYFSLYFIKKSIESTMETLEILESLYDVATIKTKTGRSSTADMLRVEMEMADTKNSLERLKGIYESTVVKFSNLLDTTLNNGIILPDTLWDSGLPVNKKALSDSILSANHNIKRLEHMVEAFRREEITARKSGGPVIITGIDYTNIGDNGISASAGTDALMLRVGITIPIYRKKYNAMAEESIMMQESANNLKQQNIITLNTVFNKSYEEYLDADRRIKLYKQQAERASAVLDILRRGYETGKTDFEEVLRIERKLLFYKIKYHKALADKQAAAAFISFLTGESIN
jgi:outer membrane protein TolC